MITRVEYDQIALEAAAPDGFEPTTLSPDEMRAKLAELGIAASSPLGRHALGGKRLWTRDGQCFQIAPAGAAGSVAASAASDGSQQSVIQIGSMIAHLNVPHATLSAAETQPEASLSAGFRIRMH